MALFADRPELLRGFRAGERDALEAVYWAYVGAVEKLAWRELARISPRSARQELPDLVQDVFVRAFSERARLGYDGLRDYAPYLLTIARNTVVDWARRRDRPLPSDGAPEPPCAPPDGADAAALRVVSAYLATLPPALAAVHEQRNVLARSQTEAAAALGLSRQQLRTREKRLHQGLARALADAGIEE